jgi:starch synthase (maltosyl-transferring)
MKAPIIYNLFPRLVGHFGRWSAHAGRARDMGFNWLFINPVQYPGFSGSLYAIKDLYRLNPLFVPPEAQDPMLELQRTIDVLHDQGLQVMMDLVINHTAKDSELIKTHPQWFRRDASGEVLSPSAIDPADTRRVTVWGDLAEVDNIDSADRAGLWDYWTEVVRHYLDLGIDGFRCDAAYKVPRKLWEQLIGLARKRRPGVVFAAETLGCRLAEISQLQGAGFDFLFNSSKWWSFDAPWCLEQHEDFQQIAPSIAFPESHDTPRLMQETGGQVQVQKQRYAFAAVFSAGLLMPIGYEFCFTTRLNVVRTTPEDWEDTRVDLSGFIKEVNRLKRALPILGMEGHWEVLTTVGQATIVLAKTLAGVDPVIVAINKDWHAAQTVALPPLEKILPRPGMMQRPFRDGQARPLPADLVLKLDPAEVVIIASS